MMKPCNDINTQNFQPSAEDSISPAPLTTENDDLRSPTLADGGCNSIGGLRTLRTLTSETNETHPKFKFTSTDSWRSIMSKVITSPGQPHNFKQWMTFWMFMFFYVLWCAPASTLLALNYQSYVIGATAWCPSGHCPGAFVFSGDASRSIAQFTAHQDKDNHNLLNALQFVSRAVEAWYAMSAVGLVYTVTMILARTEHGLPIGYMFTFMTFGDTLNIVRPPFWRTAALVNKKKNPKKKRIGRFYAFAAFAAAMGILSNLMGPSIAILMIPELRWITTKTVYTSKFESMLSGSLPVGDKLIPKCNAGNLTAKNYECNWPQSYNLDILYDFMSAQVWQNAQLPDNPLAENVKSPLLPELALSLQFNVTALNLSAHHNTYWAPNRQVVRQLSHDLEDYRRGLKNPKSKYSDWANSLTVILQRQGPIVGLKYLLWAGNHTITHIAENRQVRCYSNWFYLNRTTPVYKCHRSGRGWNESSAVNNFNVGSMASGQPSPTAWTVDTNAYFSNESIYLTELPSCLPNGTLPANHTCDWPALFSTPPPPDTPRNMTKRTHSTFILEHTILGDPARALVVEATFSIGFTLYTTDVSNASYLGTSGTVHIEELPDKSYSIPVHSAWYLLAWSVNSTHSVSWDRTSARQLQTTIGALYADLSEKGYLDWNGADAWNIWYWAQFELYGLLQMASLLPWNFSAVNKTGLESGGGTAHQSKRTKAQVVTGADIGGDEHPLLYSNAQRQVWGFGLDSKSGVLGFVVVVLGMVTVVIRVMLGIWSRIRARSSTELLVAAMKHEPQGEFFAAGRDERKMARVRFEIRNDANDELLFKKR